MTENRPSPLAKNQTSSSNSRAAARALDALNRGWDISITQNDTAKPLHLAAVETAPVPEKQNIKALLISAARAATLKIINQAEAATPERPVFIACPPDIDTRLAIAIADPSMDLDMPFKGPFQAIAADDRKLAIAAMDLARKSGLLPAFYVLEQAETDAPIASPEDITAYDDSGQIHIATRAQLPIADDHDAHIIAFRAGADHHEHVALIIGQPDDSPPLVRLHSECLTGDVFGSLKCDCGPQLSHALKAMKNSQWGILLYLRQEGRAIGLINKLRAYSLQDQGFDTVDANNRLGLPTDARDFSLAAAMLDKLGVKQLRLLTNNPAKVEKIREYGLDVVERIAHKIPPNPYNRDYLDTKKSRTGHIL